MSLNPRPFAGLRPWRRHSLVLLVAGLVYIGVGFSYISAEPTQGRLVALQVAFSWWGVNGWGAVFMTAGLLSILSSRWPPISKTWGYMVLAGLSAGWATFYLVAIIFKGAPVQNISSTLSWGLMAFLWWAISGLRNPNEPDEVFASRPVKRRRA